MKFFLIFSATLGTLSFTLGQTNKTITISNPSAESRTELVSIPFQKFAQHLGLKDTVFTVLDNTTKTPLVHQLEKLGQSSPQNVLIELTIKPKSSLVIGIEKKISPAKISKTYARYVPERKDDFAWENDVVAFRAYGKALEGGADDAQGFDFWAKRTSDLVINDWYKTADYHHDYGKGLDYYSVGQTLGVGDATPYFDKSVTYLKHYRDFKVLDNGPLRSTFKLIYEPEEVKGRKIAVEKTISLDAGSQLNRIVYKLTNTADNTTPTVIGIAKRNEDKPALYNALKSKIFAYWEPVQDDKITGTAVILPNINYTVIDNKNQFLLQTTVKNNTPIVYYAGAAFNKAGKITSLEEWKTYLTNFKNHLDQPLIIKYSN